ncbi:MAG: hypothetical protein H0X37_16940 [Herpetosiphonaceae bacterium]|nr:hypothetical protein [Herpetosiphonaceae bacterium]
MVGIGVLHLVAPEPFVTIVPHFLPEPLMLVYASGVCEIVGGIGLLLPPVRKVAGWGLIALYVAVFPANINMALNNTPIGGRHYPILLWLRLPLQGVLMAWAWWCSREETTFFWMA